MQRLRMLVQFAVLVQVAHFPHVCTYFARVRFVLTTAVARLFLRVQQHQKLASPTCDFIIDVVCWTMRQTQFSLY